MSRQSQYEARKADEARTKFSNRSLARARRGTTPNPEQLAAEQRAYNNRFGPHVDDEPMIVRATQGGYEDIVWVRPD